MDFFEFLTIFLFFAIPAGAIAFFIVSLIAFIKANNANKSAPGTFTDAQIKKREIILAISSFIMGIFVIVVAAYVGLTFLVLAFM